MASEKTVYENFPDANSNADSVRYENKTFRDQNMENVPSTVIFTDCSFVNCRIKGCELAITSNNRFDPATQILKCNFKETKINFSGGIHQIRDSVFDRCPLTGEIKSSGEAVVGRALEVAIGLDADHGTWITNTEFTECNAINIRFDKVRLTRVLFLGCRIGSQSDSYCSFAECSWPGCRFDTKKFNNCYFNDCDFSDSFFDRRTSFPDSIFDKTAFSIGGLESMDNNGEISKSEYRKLTIIDPVAVLRRAYSGFNRYVHICALLAVIAPYAWFIFIKWMKQFVVVPGMVEHETSPLIVQLLKYIYSGGSTTTEVQFGWNFISFLIVILYNVLRFFLLRKTMELELEQEIKKSSVPFELSDPVCVFGRWKIPFPVINYSWDPATPAARLPIFVRREVTWGQLSRLAGLLYWMVVVVAVIHTVGFLMTELPV